MRVLPRGSGCWEGSSMENACSTIYDIVTVSASFYKTTVRLGKKLLDSNQVRNSVLTIIAVILLSSVRRGGGIRCLPHAPCMNETAHKTHFLSMLLHVPLSGRKIYDDLQS